MWSPTISSDELYHHGIKGMHWGKRRFQNEDGSLTPAGRARYGVQQRAASYAQRKAKYYSNTAKDYEKDAQNFKERYSGKEGMDNYISDMFGDDYKSEEGRKNLNNEFFGGSGKLEDNIKVMMKTDVQDAIDYNNKMAKQYRKDADEWMAKSKKFLDTPVDKISKADFKEAKSLARIEMSHEDINAERKERLKKAAIIGASVAATALVAYGGYKLSTDPKVRSAVTKGIDAIKGVNKKTDISKAIANSGSEKATTKSLNEIFKDNPRVTVYKNGIEIGRADAANRGKEAANAVKTAAQKAAGLGSDNKLPKTAIPRATVSKTSLTFGGDTSSDANERLQKTLSQLSKMSSANIDAGNESLKFAQDLLNKNANNIIDFNKRKK